MESLVPAMETWGGNGEQMRCVKCLVDASCLVTLSPASDLLGESLLSVAYRLARLRSQSHEPTVQHRQGQTEGQQSLPLLLCPSQVLVHFGPSWKSLVLLVGGTAGPANGEGPPRLFEDWSRLLQDLKR